MKEKELRDKIKIVLKMEGFEDVWFSPSFQKMRWDIFTIFDCIAVKGYITRFIQFTTITNTAHRRHKMQDYMRDHIDFENAWLYSYNEAKDEWRKEKVNKPSNGIPVPSI